MGVALSLDYRRSLNTRVRPLKDIAAPFAVRQIPFKRIQSRTNHPRSSKLVRVMFSIKKKCRASGRYDNYADWPISRLEICFQGRLSEQLYLSF